MMIVIIFIIIALCVINIHIIDQWNHEIDFILCGMKAKNVTPNFYYYCCPCSHNYHSGNDISPLNKQPFIPLHSHNHPKQNKSAWWHRSYLIVLIQTLQTSCKGIQSFAPYQWAAPSSIGVLILQIAYGWNIHT